jgi:hypothetical protein
MEHTLYQDSTLFLQVFIYFYKKNNLFLLCTLDVEKNMRFIKNNCAFFKKKLYIFN